MFAGFADDVADLTPITCFLVKSLCAIHKGLRMVQMENQTVYLVIADGLPEKQFSVYRVILVIVILFFKFL